MTAPNDVRGHVTTESTKKSLKLQKVIAVLALIASICVTFFAADPTLSGTGMVTTFFSIVWIGIVNFRIWWEHG